MPLSGRARRAVKVTGAVLIAGAALAGAGLLWQAIASRRDRQRYPASGRLLDVDGRRMHVVVSGSGAPVVVLESGIGASSLSWQLVQPEIARFTTVFSYDRKGLGWSESGDGSLSTRGLVAGLRRALFAAGLEGPFLLVGHSFGGLVVRAYAASFPEEIAGIILVDPVLPSEWIDIPRARRNLLRFGAMLCRRGALLSRLGVVRFALRLMVSGANAVPRYIAQVSSGPGAEVIERLVGEVRKLPPPSWPIIQAQWSRPDSFRGLAAHLESLPLVAEEVEAMTITGIPVTVLSASNATAEQQREWDRLIARGNPGVHRAATQGGHGLHLDEPMLVIEAVRQMIDGIWDKRKAILS